MSASEGPGKEKSVEMHAYFRQSPLQTWSIPGNQAVNAERRRCDTASPWQALVDAFSGKAPLL
jgi:hypothetical protein